MILQFNGKNGFVELEVGKLFCANFGEGKEDSNRLVDTEKYLAIMEDKDSEDGYSVFKFKTENEFNFNTVGKYYSPVSTLKDLICTFEPC